MTTDKKHIHHLALICYQKGIKHAVISPGSRCAPIIIAFNRVEGMQCHSVIDERSAAFIALGIAQQLQEPVALICTSGSALLNYAPAIAEAFYQKIPLLILSADRPNEWIDQGENQSINQEKIYQNYIKKSIQLPLQIHSEKDLWYSDRMISEAINSCLQADFGPVHINIPLREPLYQQMEYDDNRVKIIDFEKGQKHLSQQQIDNYSSLINQFSKILIVVGSLKKFDKQLNKVLQRISQFSQFIVVKESISNVYGDDFIENIDGNIECIQAIHDPTPFQPNLIISLGGGLVTKKMKFWLRSLNNCQHWHISQSFEHWDIFQCLSKVIDIDAVEFFNSLQIEAIQSNFKKDWLKLNQQVLAWSEEYLSTLPFSDFSIYKSLIPNLTNVNLQMGNSTPIRYANLISINEQQAISVNANRGVSGIDGVLSTAVGASLVSDKDCYCICGDVAALYDSNALMHNTIQANLKLIIVNNQGGNIFKIIPGPSNTNELSRFFETKHDFDFKHLAAMYRFNYIEVNNENQMQTAFDQLSKARQKTIVEIKTDSEISANTLKNYFTYLREKIKNE